MKCELCGTPVKVVGRGTLHYEPLSSDGSTLEWLPVAMAAVGQFYLVDSSLTPFSTGPEKAFKMSDGTWWNRGCSVQYTGITHCMPMPAGPTGEQHPGTPPKRQACIALADKPKWSKVTTDFDDGSCTLESNDKCHIIGVFVPIPDVKVNSMDDLYSWSVNFFVGKNFGAIPLELGKGRTLSTGGAKHACEHTYKVFKASGLTAEEFIAGREKS